MPIALGLAATPDFLAGLAADVFLVAAGAAASVAAGSALVSVLALVALVFEGVFFLVAPPFLPAALGLAATPDFLVGVFLVVAVFLAACQVNVKVSVKLVCCPGS